MSNKDLLKLENEYRKELPKYRTKPTITTIEKPTSLTKRVSDFLAGTSKPDTNIKKEVNEKKADPRKVACEMDIYISPLEE